MITIDHHSTGHGKKLSQLQSCCVQPASCQLSTQEHMVRVSFRASLAVGAHTHTQTALQEHSRGSSSLRAGV